MSDVQDYINHVAKKLPDVFSDANLNLDQEYLSSGSILLDHYLGGGFPCGQLVEVYGNEGSGKTSLAIHVVAEAQKAGKEILYIDAERRINQKWMNIHGVDVNELKKNKRIIRVAHGEKVLDLALGFIKARGDLIVIDSLPSLASTAELEGDMADQQMGLQARMYGKFFRKLLAENVKTTIFMINQFRDKIGVIYGDPRTTPGGKAKNFFSSVRLEMAAGEYITNDLKVPIGQIIKFKTKKNTFGIPGQASQIKLMFDGYFDNVSDAIKLAKLNGTIKQAGPWITYKDKKYQGEKEFLREVDMEEFMEEVLGGE